MHCCSGIFRQVEPVHRLRIQTEKFEPHKMTLKEYFALSENKFNP